MELSKKRPHDGISDADGVDQQRRPKRVIGPSLPPSSAAGETKSSQSQASETDSDDDIGPMVPSIDSAPPADAAGDSEGSLLVPMDQQNDVSDSKNKIHRDQWMLELPDTNDIARQIDPTKLRNRKFLSGRSTKAASPGSKVGDDSWMESPDERIRRLQNSVMGVASSSVSTSSHKYGAEQQQKKARNERMKVQAVSPHVNTHPLSTFAEPALQLSSRTEKLSHGNSQHQRNNPKQDTKDTADKFDWTRDMAITSGPSKSRRQEILDRASKSGSRFTRGEFL